MVTVAWRHFFPWLQDLPPEVGFPSCAQSKYCVEVVGTGGRVTLSPNIMLTSSVGADRIE